MKCDSNNKYAITFCVYISLPILMLWKKFPCCHYRQRDWNSEITLKTQKSENENIFLNVHNHHWNGGDDGWGGFNWLQSFDKVNIEKSENRCAK